MRTHSRLDRILMELDHGLRNSHAVPPAGQRTYPADHHPHPDLASGDQSHVAGLMRVNNSGEVAAQGLYRGQALTARNPAIHEAMQQAAAEENEHLSWCQQRLTELGARRSLLDPIWYWGSFSIGALAGLFGDRWSLGFVEETERQVSAHLDDHLRRLPDHDQRSEAILRQMQRDEERHAETARAAGASSLPVPIRKLMTLTSRIMTSSAYRV